MLRCSSVTSPGQTHSVRLPCPDQLAGPAPAQQALPSLCPGDTQAQCLQLPEETGKPRLPPCGQLRAYVSQPGHSHRTGTFLEALKTQLTATNYVVALPKPSRQVSPAALMERKPCFTTSHPSREGREEQYFKKEEMPGKPCGLSQSVRDSPDVWLLPAARSGGRYLA